MKPPIRNGIDPNRYLVGTVLRNLTEFRDRVINDSTAMRAHSDFQRAHSEFGMKQVSLDEFRELVQTLTEAPKNLLQFPESCAKALSRLMELGWRLQKREKFQSFLGGITPAPQNRKDWQQLLKAGYFK